MAPVLACKDAFTSQVAYREIQKGIQDDQKMKTRLKTYFPESTTQTNKKTVQ
jgi:hypothetical protein